MNTLFYLSQNAPQAQPVPFDFDGLTWLFWPLHTVPIAMIMERWVVQFVARNSETLRPDDGNQDPVAWRIYNEWADKTRKEIDRGEYAALQPGWTDIINRAEPAFAEAIHQCLNWKTEEKDGMREWTRDLTRRLFASPEKYAEINELWRSLNYPKKKSQSANPSQNGAVNSGRSNGETSSAVLSDRGS